MTRAKDMSDFGPSASAGAVLEEFCSPCDGSAITVRSGTYTVGNVSGVQAMTTTHADITGSSITYTPPTGTQTVVYNFNFTMCRGNDSRSILHTKLLIGGTEVTNFRKSFSYQDGTNPELSISVFWAFNIGGSTTDATGRQASWTSGKEIKLQGRDYSDSFDTQLHEIELWDGQDSQSVFSQPVIGIKALA